MAVDGNGACAGASRCSATPIAYRWNLSADCFYYCTYYVSFNYPEHKWVIHIGSNYDIFISTYVTVFYVTVDYAMLSKSSYKINNKLLHCTTVMYINIE